MKSMSGQHVKQQEIDCSLKVEPAAKIAEQLPVGDLVETAPGCCSISHGSISPGEERSTRLGRSRKLLVPLPFDNDHSTTSGQEPSSLQNTPLNARRKHRSAALPLVVLYIACEQVSFRE